MPDPAINAFLACWAMRDQIARRKAIATLLDPDLVYLDPHYEEPIVGRDAYVDFVDEVIRRFPAISFTGLGHNNHHGVGLMDWRLQLYPAGQASFGAFFYSLSDDGRLSRLVGFAREL